MSCGCFDVEWEKVTEPSSVSYIRMLVEGFSVTFKRVCGTIVDLVAFNAADGGFLTSEGYTIIVKN